MLGNVLRHTFQSRVIWNGRGQFGIPLATHWKKRAHIFDPSASLLKTFGDDLVQTRFTSGSRETDGTRGWVPIAGSRALVVQWCKGFLSQFNKSLCTIRWHLGVPTLGREWLAAVDPKTLPRDLVSMASVICVAVPLNTAIAVASGVPPQLALVTAGIAAPVAAVFGGTTLAVTGPAAAISVLVAQAVNHHGLAALPLITLSVGGLQLLSGVFNAGWLVKLTPVPVIAGFTTGVGTLIAVGQLPRLLGLPSAGSDVSAFGILQHVASHLSAADPLSLALGAVSFAVVMAVPKLHKQAGGFSILAAVTAGTAASMALSSGGFGSVALVGAMPPLVLSDLCRLPALTDLLSLTPTIALIFSLTSVESLLSCVAIDKMRQTPYKHDASQELIGQGMANIAAGCFSGMPVTSVIARSTVNVQSGALTRMSSFGHGFVVLFGIGALGPMLALVPMPVLAAVLVNAGSKMLVPAEVVHCLRVRRSDIMPYATTVLGMLTVGLAEGVMMGMAASLIFSGANWDQPQTCRMSFELAFSVRTAVDLHTEAELWSMDKARLIRLLRGSYDVELQHNLASYATPDDLGRTCPECDGVGEVMRVMSSVDTPDDLHGDSFQECMTCQGTGTTSSLQSLPQVWQLTGPLNFLSVFRIAELMNAVAANRGDLSRCIFDLHSCRTVDLTGAEALLDGLRELRAAGIKVSLMNAPAEFEAAMLSYAKIEQFEVYTHAVGTRPRQASEPAPDNLFVRR